MFKLRFLDSTKKTFQYLAIMMMVALVFFAIFIAIYSDAYYTCCSDDLLQYFKIEEEFVLKLKTGNLSFYSFSNYLGASFYSDTYYIQLDFFTIIATIISFFTNFEIAFGITEMIKLISGTLMFAYFLYLRKCSNKAIFVGSLIYFVCGYNSVMMAFSGFFSLVFYYPFSAICIEKYKSGNKILLPLCTALLVFYNFYLGACVMLSMGAWFILSYFLDNKLETIKEELIAINPENKHITFKAVLIYLKRGLVTGVMCALYMIVGILIACIVLIPSLSFFLKDSYPRTDKFYIWSFNAKEGYEQLSAIKMYMRILGNLFTPTYSTDFYGFINDYITDHNSLYVTITGLMILLFVFKLKDRESRIYKIALVIEVLLLLFPFTYMLFSLNGCPYTRWFGMLNMLNILVIAHVITKTDFKFDMLSVKSIITNLLVVVIIVIVLNYYLKNVFGASIIDLLKGKSIEENSKLEDMQADVLMLIIAIFLIILITSLSGKKLQKKFNIMPYVLVCEMIVSFCFMFEPKSENYNVIYLSDRKEELNSYMDKYLEIPYGNNFSRTHVKTYINDDYVYADNFSRTNLHLSDLRVFHSFYDCNTNELARMYYDTSSGSGETRNSKLVINEYSMFVHQTLGTKYVVVDSKDYGTRNYYLPEKYYKLINNNGQFMSYENLNYAPFMIYDKQASTSKLTPFTQQIVKQQYALNYCFLDPINEGDKEDEKILPIANPTGYGIKHIIDYDEKMIDENRNMVGYNISEEWDNIYSSGIMHFYLDGGQGARSMEFKDVVLEYKDGRRENGFSGYAFYSEVPKTIWIERTSSYNRLSDSSRNLRVEFTNYDEYDKYIDRMNSYSDLKLLVDNNKLHLSYHRDNDEANIVVLPISYNDCWTIDNNYRILKTHGGLLGIVVPKGTKDISFNLEFKPRYINGSALITIAGTIIYGLVLIGNYRRLKEDEENYNYCTLL